MTAYEVLRDCHIVRERDENGVPVVEDYYPEGTKLATVPEGFDPDEMVKIGAWKKVGSDQRKRTRG